MPSNHPLGVRPAALPLVCGPIITTSMTLTTVTGNRLIHNAGDGLHVLAPPFRTLDLTVGGNGALANAGHGIDVAAPNVVVTDAGGNSAHGNAPPQCLGVACS